MKLSIKYKIFFTLLLTSIVVATSLHSFLRWNFGRGFSKYVQSQELEQLDKLSEELTSLYEKNSNWQVLVGNHSLWRQLHNAMASSSQKTERKDMGKRERRRPPHFPPHGEPNDIGPRLILFDLNKNRVIGGEDSPGNLNNLELRPITDGENTLGYLALIPVKELQYDRDKSFVKKQTDFFALIAVFMVALSLLLSYPVTMHLLRPVNALKKGTRKLIAGRFKTRIPVTTTDELGQLSYDFNILAKTLEKNEQNRQQWVADISHELRTPLAILRGEVEAIQDGIRQPEPQVIDAVHGEIMHLERMVGDLYELSMSDIGALNYKRVDVDPIAILAGTVELFEQRVGSQELSVNIHLPVEAPCSVVADPDRLQQLFINLLENSLRYTDLPGKIEITLEIVQTNIIISFEDSSPGISPEQLPKLFDRLYRGEGSRNRGTGGAGLGLAICKNIVEAHQGKIMADNSPLGGILIQVEIPKNA